MAKVRLSIEGIEATKKNLEALKNGAEATRAKIEGLHKEMKQAMDTGDLKGADKIMREINRQESILKSTNKLIKDQENAIGKYDNIMDHLSSSTLNELNRAARDLQAQMKATLKAADPDRWKQLNSAYKEVMTTIEQLNGKAPNLAYVMQNLGTVSEKSLKDTDEYLKKLIADTDKGSQEIIALQQKLQQVQAEQRSRDVARSERVLGSGNLSQFSSTEIQEAVKATEKLRDTQQTGTPEWHKFNEQIRIGNEYLAEWTKRLERAEVDKLQKALPSVSDSQLAAQRKYWEQMIADSKQGTNALDIYRKKLAEVIAEEQSRQDKAAGKIMANLDTSSINEIQEAIRATEKLRDAQKAGSTEWTIYNGEVEKAKKYLQDYADMNKQIGMENQLINISSLSTDALAAQRKYWEGMVNGAERGTAELTRFEQKLKQVQAEQQTRLASRANVAISDVSGGTFDGSAAQAKEALDTLQKYKDSLNLSTQQAEIERVTLAMEAYNAALGKVKESAIDVQKVLADPKSYSAKQIEEAIKQLEELRNSTQVGDTTQLRQTTEDIERLKQALAESQYAAQGMDGIVQKAQSGYASIAEMEKAVATLNDRLKNTPKNQTQEIEKIRQQLDVLNPAIAETRRAIANVDAVLGNLKGASLNDLKSAAEALEKEIRSAAAGTQEFINTAKDLKQVKARIKELEGEWSNTSDAMDNAISRLKNWVLIYAGFDAITGKIHSAVTENLAFSDSLSDVRKVTGLQVEEVSKLADKIQEMNTRITDPKLLAAATEGGRLGLKRAEDIFAFTKASAITLTALDELDESSINSIMKLNNLLGETEKLGVQDAILSTASSINELSIASAAAQRPIIDFSRRFGGIASQANISTAEVVALGATLDALGQPMEMSSTAMNKFTTALLSNQAEIAKATGLSEEYMLKMTQQGKTIELMIEVLTRLSGMGGIGEISKYMGDMGGDGARMTAVISALASNIGFLRQQLDVSNAAFQEGTSVINEYNIKNENAAALAERIGNTLYAAFVNSKMVSVLTSILKPMESFVSFLTSGSAAAKTFNYAMLAIITTMMTYGKLTVKLSVLLKGFFTGIINSLKGAWTYFRLATSSAEYFGLALKALAKNPFTWIFVILPLIADLIGLFDSATDETKNLKSATDQANEAFENERFKLIALKDQLDKATADKKGYAEVISTLNRDYGKHIGYLLDEAAGYKEIASAIDVATAALRRKTLEDARNNVVQQVNEEYRMPLDEARKGLRANLPEIPGITEEVGKEFYRALNKDMLERVARGEDAGMGEETAAALQASAKQYAQNMIEIGMRQESERDEIVARRIEFLKNRIQSLDSYQNLVSLYNDREKEIQEQTFDANQELLVSQNKEIDVLREHADSIITESEIMSKAAKDFTAADEKDLDAIVKTRENIRNKINSSIDEEGWKKANEDLEAAKKLQREVMLAYVENPLRGIKLEEVNGKLEKLIEENGRFKYEAVGKLTDANLRMLQQAYIRAEATFQKINKDENLKLDAAWREQAFRLGEFKESVEDYLKKYHIDIDDKGEVTLGRKPKTSGRGRKSEDEEMKKNYRALLANLKEHFDKQKVETNKAYLANEMTAEQHQQKLDLIERTHLKVRAEMQKKLLGGKDSTFDENEYIRDINNYNKVSGWMLKPTHNFQDEVRKDMEAGNLKIQEELVKHNKEIEKILLDQRMFEKVRRQYQTELEKLDLLFIRKDDIGAEDFSGMQKRADEVMKLLAKAGEEAADMSYQTFRDIVSKYEGTGDLMLATQQKDGTLLMQGTESDWQAIYSIIMKYNNDIQEARVKMYNDNKNMIEKIVSQSDSAKSISTGKEGIKDEMKQEENRSRWGSVSEADSFKRMQALQLQALDNDIAYYDMKWFYAKEYYDKMIAAEQDEEVRKVLQLQKDQQLAEIERESQEKQAEYLQEITEAYMTEYDRRLNKATEYADRIGEFTGTMASAAWNTVDDRKRAGEELLKWMAEETKRYILELVTRSIKEKIQQKIDIASTKETEEKKNKEEQKGAEVSEGIQEVAGKAKVALQKTIGGTVTNVAKNAAAENATTSVKEASVETTSGIAAGAAKIIAKLGPWGIPLIAVITALLNGLLSMATNSLTSAFGKTNDVNTGSSKRLATGMLTYKNGRMPVFAEGRYSVQGNDGNTYDAQYEPELQTRIYKGGNGKAHFGIFSEVMPEMVISGPTTKIIQEDYPGLLNAIMTIDRHGRLKNAMPTYASGNLPDIGSISTDEEGAPLAQNPMQEQMAQMSATMQQMLETNAELNRQLRNGIQAQIVMYGKGGLKENLDKADKFYSKNRIK